jgi:Ca-activated chloride channel family protein
LANVARINEAGAKIYSFGVGYDVNTTLLDGLARESGASAHYIVPGENIDAILSGFYREVQAPVATDLSLSSTGVTLSEHYPDRLPDLFVGTNAFLAATYSEPAGDVDLWGSAKFENGRGDFAIEGSIAVDDRSYPFVPRIWASRKLGELLFEARQNGGAESTVDQIRELALRFGFVTRWTPFAMTADGEVERGYSNPTGEASGQDAVGTSAGINGISDNSNAANYGGSPSMTAINYVGDRTFLRMHGYWIDSRLANEEVEPLDIEAIDIDFMGPGWLALLQAGPEARELLATGRSMIFEWRCQIIRVNDPSVEEVEIPQEEALPEALLNPDAPIIAPLPEGRRSGPFPGDLETAEPSCRSIGGEGDSWFLLAGIALFCLRCARRRESREY